MEVDLQMLTREEILAKRELPREEVEAWGGKVTVRALTGRERDEFEESLIGDRKTGVANLSNVRAKLVAKTIVDSAGKRIFSDADIAELGDLDASELQKCFEVAQRLSGLTTKDVEELAKN